VFRSEEADWVTKSPVRHKLYRVLLTFQASVEVFKSHVGISGALAHDDFTDLWSTVSNSSSLFTGLLMLTELLGIFEISVGNKINK
jgi:hypothetical protein